MIKRLLKRHKRQVTRARSKVRVSEPDVRTPDQIAAAREASRPDKGQGNEPVPLYARSPGRSQTSSGPGRAETAPDNKEIG